MADGMGGGPVSAGTIASQAGKKLGTPNAPYTGVPGYTDTVFDPFSVNPVAPEESPQYEPNEDRGPRNRRDPYTGEMLDAY